ncbi:MAG: alpha-L-rhamnosidase, partial [Jatrophihabitans sp.]|nr:alpha-L-rhamnosidase [Jatrophihabitans sp.]
MEHDRRPRGLSRRRFLQAGAALGAGAAAAAAGGPAWADGRGDPLRVGRLRAGAVRDPIGIQSPRPQLSWQLTGAGRQRRQTAYQLRVASSAARLGGGRADLWDTGRVTS